MSSMSSSSLFISFFLLFPLRISLSCPGRWMLIQIGSRRQQYRNVFDRIVSIPQSQSQVSSLSSSHLQKHCSISRCHQSQSQVFSLSSCSLDQHCIHPSPFSKALFPSPSISMSLSSSIVPILHIPSPRSIQILSSTCPSAFLNSRYPLLQHCIHLHVPIVVIYPDLIIYMPRRGIKFQPDDVIDWHSKTSGSNGTMSLIDVRENQNSVEPCGWLTFEKIGFQLNHVQHSFRKTTKMLKV